MAVHNSEIAEIFERWQSIWLSRSIPNALRRFAARGLGTERLRQRLRDQSMRSSPELSNNHQKNSDVIPAAMTTLWTACQCRSATGPFSPLRWA
jgi:hypothetical protein